MAPRARVEKVRHDIRATFRFAADGRTTDTSTASPFVPGSRQALGPVGLLLDWTPLLRAVTKRSAREQLAKFRVNV